MKKKIIIFIFLSFSILSFCNAQDSLNDESITPVMMNHKFQFLKDMRSPFIRTNMSLNFGIGESNTFTTDGVPVGDSSIFRLSNELLFAGFGASYNQKIKNWVSFYLKYEYAARTGTEISSVLVEGISTITTVETGGKFLLAHGTKHQLALLLTMTRIDAQVVDVRKYVDDLVSGNPTASVTKRIPALLTGGGLVFSAAPNQVLGFNFDSQLVYGETLERTGSKFQYYFAGNVDLYLEPWITIPVNVTLGGSTNTIVNAFSIHGSHTSTYNFKLSYSGSDAFLLGLEFYKGVTPITNTNRHVGVSGVSFTCSMYFD